MNLELKQMRASERGLGFYSAQSFVLHGLLLGLCLLLAKIVWDSSAELRNANIQLVESSVRVEVVAMPEFTVQELKIFEEVEEVSAAPAPEVAKKEEPPAKPDQPEFIEEKKKTDFAAMLKNLSQKKVVEKAGKDKTKEQPKKEASAFDQKRLQKLVAAGNKLSAGTALIGAQGQAAQGEFAQYLGSMPDAVRPHWRLPSYLANQGLKARVRVFLKSDGTLIKAEIYESSGVAEYDQRAMDAVRRARFGVLPEGQAARAVAGEIVLGFPL